MSGQTFAVRRPGRSSLLAKWAPRGLRPPASPGDPKSPQPSDSPADGPELESISPASARRRWGVEPGIIFHLVCVGALGTVIIAASFGAAFYSLGRLAEEVVSNSVGQKLARVALPPPGERSTGADAPPLITASLGVLAASTADPPALGARGAVGEPALEPSTPTKAPGVASEPHPGPTQGQVKAHPDPKRPKDASTDLVTGVVIEATDAMTWVVDDQIIHLWGIRPGPGHLNPSLRTLVDSVRTKGPVKCHRQPYSTRYQCFTATGEDIGKAALVVGVGQAADGASLAYREAEAEAHRQGREASAELRLVK